MTRVTRAPRPDLGSVARCPVCRVRAPLPFMQVDEHDYLRCEHCEARFRHPDQHPSPEVAHAHYRQHRNDPDDPRYREFLARLVKPLLGKLHASANGLDYGCGPGSAVAAMLREAGHAVALYDPFFKPDEAALRRRYDFVTCTEVVEHFHDPYAEFERIAGLLNAGGWLAVMTCFQTEDARFAAWHYRRDPTHVVFYREQTLRAVARQRGWGCEIPAKDVALMQLPG